MLAAPVGTARNPARRRPAIVVAVVLCGLVGFGGYSWWAAQYPKRFAVVEPGRLYRSGAITPAQLARLHATYGIERVICLLATESPEAQAEHAAAQRLGLDWHNIPMGGDGTSTPPQRDQLRALLLDPNAPPTLVHCAAGTNRTGLAVGLYRIHHDGWTCDQVLDEMRRFSFDDLPKHENLRAALRAEAAHATSQPAPATAPAP